MYPQNSVISMMDSRKLSPEQVGGKFLSLYGLRSDLNIPLAICLPPRALKDSLGMELSTKIESGFKELAAARGLFVDQFFDQLDEWVQNLSLAPIWHQRIQEQLVSLFPHEGIPHGETFAVRSSAANENVENSSFSGIYDSFLDVRPGRDLYDSIVKCWKSCFTRRSLLQNLRAGSADFLSFAVIVQEMITDVELGGIAIGGNSWKEGSPQIEWDYGHPSRLLNGFTPPQSTPLNARVRNLVSDVVERSSHETGSSVEIEWGWAKERVFVFQVRSINTPPSKKATTEFAFWKVQNLYDTAGSENQPEYNFSLDSLEPVYQKMVDKRAGAIQLARKYGLETTTGVLLAFNGLALESQDFVYDLDKCLGNKVVVDVNKNVRQVVIDRKALYSFLGDLISPDGAGDIHTLIVRDYREGQYGAISRRLDDGQVVIEYSADGLMGLNRGTAINISQVTYDEAQSGHLSSQDNPPAWTRKIAEFSGAFTNSFFPSQLEWVICDEEPVFIDFTKAEDKYAIATAGATIYSGIARGPILFIRPDHRMIHYSVGATISVDDYSIAGETIDFDFLTELIEDFDEPPLVFAPLPYTALSVLVGQVAGFVFNEGSIFSHLAVILRENKIPSLIAPFPDHIVHAEIEFDELKLL